MKIYTKTGDKGETSLFGGKRVKKNHARLNAYGTIDELNSFLGLVISEMSAQSRPTFAEILKNLVDVQIELFNIGSHLACDKKSLSQKLPKLNLGLVQRLESSIDKMESQLTPLKNFILPGGHVIASHIHVARTVSRRAERAVVELMPKIKVDRDIIIFLNRLSDYLFVLSRFVNFTFKISEQLWVAR